MGKTKNIIIILVILIIVSFAGLFIYKDFKSSQDINKDKEQNLDDDILEEKIENSGNSAETEQTKENTPALADIQKIKVPDLSKQPIVSVSLPENIKKSALEEITILSNSLKKNYDSWGEWVQLGLLKKLIGDYEGARISWEFATEIRPKDSISRHNLGNLYWQNLKDFKKAEKNYLESLELNKQDISAYIDLSSIYYYELKNIAKTKEILMKGLKANPENQELLRTLKEIE